MAASTVIRNIGSTNVLSVAATSTAAVTIAPNGTAIQAFASFLNTGPAVVAVNIASNGVAAPAVMPAVGTAQTCILLPALMLQPLLYAVPMSFSCTAIGSAIGPSLVYITPVSTQT